MTHTDKTNISIPSIPYYVGRSDSSRTALRRRERERVKRLNAREPRLVYVWKNSEVTFLPYLHRLVSGF